MFDSGDQTELGAEPVSAAVYSNVASIAHRREVLALKARSMHHDGRVVEQALGGVRVHARRCQGPELLAGGERVERTSVAVRDTFGEMREPCVHLTIRHLVEKEVCL